MNARNKSSILGESFKFNEYFHPLEALSRYRDLQLQAGEKNVFSVQRETNFCILLTVRI